MLQVKDATIGYDKDPIIEHVTMRLTRGDSVALVKWNWEIHIIKINCE